VNFNSGDSYELVTMPVLTDAPGDGPQSLGLVLSNPVGATLGDPTFATVTITDPPPPVVQFDSTAYSTYDDAGSLVVQLDRYGDTRNSSTVWVSSSDGSATANTDYGPVSEPVTFGAGQEIATVSVPILNDTSADGNDNFTLNVIPVDNAVIGDIYQTNVTLSDSASSAFTFDQSAISDNEDDGTATIVVDRNGDTSEPASVFVSATGGSAIPGTDYNLAPQTLQFAAYQQSKSFTVSILASLVAGTVFSRSGIDHGARAGCVECPVYGRRHAPCRPSGGRRRPCACWRCRRRNRHRVWYNCSWRCFMSLPDFLTQDSDGHIHVTGHRVGLHDVVFFYNQGYSAEMLQEAFPTLPPAMIHKILAYYLENQAAVDVAVVANEAEMERQRAASPRGPDLAELRRRLKAKQAAEA
jgi:uncharacterized protein (DUF433 family)